MSQRKTVDPLVKAASLLDMSTTELRRILTAEFNTIKVTPTEYTQYPTILEPFIKFTLERLNELDEDHFSILRKIVHRDDARKLYFYPNEIEAVKRILTFIEKAEGHELRIDNLDLKTLPPLLLKTRRLEFLDISNNKIQDLSIIAGLSDLRILIANHNDITNLSTLVGVKNLHTLDLAFNGIRESLEHLHHVPSLHTLVLSGNKINDPQAKVLLEVPFLTMLILEDNPVNAPVDILKDIEKMRAYYSVELSGAQKAQAKQAKQNRAEPAIPAQPVQTPDSVFLSSAIRDIRLRGNPDKVLLDIEKLAPIFYDLISNSDEYGEHFFGLFGRWGRGKTFFWRYILQHNLNKEKYIPIEFHAWKYQDTPGIWAYLYNTLNDAYMGEKPKWYQFSKWYRYFQKLIKLNGLRGKFVTATVIFLGMVSTIFAYFYKSNVEGKSFESNALFIGIPVTVIAFLVYIARNFHTDARKIISSLTTNVNFNSELGFQHEIQQELKHLFKAWIPEKDKFKKKIFLFIDDIDRCSEDKIIQIVDYIRVLLHCKDIQDRITVLAAIDERILLHAIQEKYKRFIANKDNDATYKELCREYMDKLFLAGLKLGPLTEFEKRQIVEGFTDADTSNIVVWPDYEKNGLDGEKVAEVINQTNEKEPEIPGSNEIKKVATKKVVIPEQEQQIETPGKSNGTAIPVTPSQIASTARKEFPYEKWEQEFIKDILARNTESTPRSIRVYTYRYLLGKQLVEKALREGKASWKQWYNTKEAKQCFAIKLLHYGFKSDTEHLIADYKNFIANYDESNTVKENIYGYEIALNQELGSIMYQVLTMIIAY